MGCAPSHVLHGHTHGGVCAAIVHYDHLVGEAWPLFISPLLQVPERTVSAQPLRAKLSSCPTAGVLCFAMAVLA